MRPGAADPNPEIDPGRLLPVDGGSGRDDAGGQFAALDVPELQSLLLNLDAARRVYARAHLFGWTQGLLQGLIRHDVLVCAARGGERQALCAESFSVTAPDSSVFGKHFLRDAPTAQQLVQAWEERRFRPMLCNLADAGRIAQGVFARELQRIGAVQLLVHGTHDSEGRMASLFLFACAPGAVGPRQAYLVQLVAPFLHAAWVRARYTGRAKRGEQTPTAGTGNITAREQEILKWIYLGKSNIEIGAILDISPLTVKNHVQKMLRKLNVVNRAQAVGRALELRILKP